MSEIEVETDALRGLTEHLASLVQYCEALQSGASGVAYMLPEAWHGPAMSAFLGSFEAWASSAAALALSAGDLRDLASAALSAHEAAITHADTIMSSAASQISQVGV
jgi:uncharacterized protein YukE